MVARIVIAGESQCDVFAQICLIANFLSQNLPSFCYERIEKPVLEWKAWLCKINQKNKWHHTGSPLVWKELLTTGSKPLYIGGAPEFMDYCNSYYDLDVFMTSDTYENLVSNYRQYYKRIKQENKTKSKNEVEFDLEEEHKNSYVICITGAGNPIAMHIISGLLETTFDDKSICKIYIYDGKCLPSFMESVERECSYIGTNYPPRVVKYVDKIGVALTNTDVLIVLDHVPLSDTMSIGGWLYENKKVMEKIALMINASASQTMNVILPNLGPACFNATILAQSITHISRHHIVVATSDLGMEAAPIIAKIAEVPMRNMFCPPVWGFVGINHLIDVNNTVHKYNGFDPYSRYTKVRNSSLCIGKLTPEMRTLEYLLYFDQSLWNKIADQKAKGAQIQTFLNKSTAIIDLLKIGLFDSYPHDVIVNIGIRCDGSFGLHFNGYFSQPCRYVNGIWKPAKHYMPPKDREINIKYLEDIAKFCMKLQKNDLPPIIPRKICVCKPKYFKKKKVW
ncbi:putative malate dehydrogenase 1B [Colias croceus]|uniref:putative malate dehydrogenase 1B n=1 Tax=Colias crocea TaxID=72248 RepID=UPI001E27B04D|nr:putative malate dehydrogenase 1B [Colias croceus]